MLTFSNYAAIIIVIYDCNILNNTEITIIFTNCLWYSLDIFITRYIIFDNYDNMNNIISYCLIAQIANTAREISSFADQHRNIAVLRRVESGFNFRIGRMIQQLLPWSGLKCLFSHVIYRSLP